MAWQPIRAGRQKPTANGVPKNLAHSAANIVPNFCHGISCGGVREQMACQTFVMRFAVVGNGSELRGVSKCRAKLLSCDLRERYFMTF